MNASKIILVRHGQTEWNKAGRLHGRSDLPLNDTGIQQAHLLAMELGTGGALDAVYSSPLFRALQTAQIIAKALNLPKVQENPELMEREFGESEGQLVRDLPLEQRAQLMNLGETEEHLVERAVNALFKISAQHPHQRVLVVSHGELIRSVMTTLTGVDQPHVANAQVFELDPTVLANHVAREPLWH